MTKKIYFDILWFTVKARFWSSQLRLAEWLVRQAEQYAAWIAGRAQKGLGVVNSGIVSK